MSFHEVRRRLQEFNLRLRRRLEEAEARIPELNELIERVASLGVLPDLVLLGKVALQRPYDTGQGPEDSSQVLQAALLVPGGLGAVIWDTEDLLSVREEPGGLVPHAKSRFFPFDELSPGEKGVLFAHFAPLVERLWEEHLCQANDKPDPAS